MQENKVLIDTINIRNITQRKVAILGGTGSGKTTTLKLMALESADSLPCYVFDPLNVINIKGFDKIRFSKENLEKGKAAGRLFNQSLKNKKVIFGFKGMLQEEFAVFINDFFGAWNPHDCLIFFDEMHEAVPESGSAAKYAPEVERLWKHGRNSNIGFIGTSQRPAFVKKNALALTDYMILYRTTYPTDIDVIKSIIGNILSPEELESVIKNIQTKPFLNGYYLDFRYIEA